MMFSYEGKPSFGVEGQLDDPWSKNTGLGDRRQKKMGRTITPVCFTEHNKFSQEMTLNDGKNMIEESLVRWQ